MASKTLTSSNDTYNAAEHGETTTIDGGAGTDTIYLDGRAGVALSFSFDGTYIHVDGVSGASAWHFKLTNVEKFKYGSTVTDLTTKFPSAFSNAPTIAITSDLSTLKTGQTAIVTFTLSASSTDFTSDDVTVTGGILTNFSGSGTTYTATFTPSSNSTNNGVISVANNKFSNASATFNTDGSDANNTLTMTVDTVAPTVSTFSPADGASSVVVDSNIVITFSEAIKFGSGNIVLKSGSTIIATYTVSSPGANLSISGSTLTINPSASLSTSTSYTIEFAAGAITDSAGNAFTQSTVYDFTTSSVNVIQGSAKADTLTGSANDDQISGLAGNDLIDGLAGADTMVGGLGNETYVVNNAGDVVTEDLNSGTDLVKSSISYELGDNLENLTLTDGSATGGTAAIDGTGNALANTIIGNAGDNVLDGGLGKDKLTGGDGDDTYILDLTSAGKVEDTITETKNTTNQDTMQLRGSYSAAKNIVFTLAANLENLDASATVASPMDIKGNTANNSLTGNDGNNLIDGLAGNDTMIGGAGNDTYVVDSNSDVVTEDASKGTDLVKVVSKTANETYTLNDNVENGTLGNTVAYNLTGNALDNLLTGNKAANTLTGGDGNDTLDGSGGVDSMLGGAGNDTYLVDNSADVVDEQTGSGSDLVKSSVSYSLATVAASNIEDLMLTGTKAANATGNSLSNGITGNTGVNILDGGAGADTLTGGAGKDVFLFKNTDAVDTITDFVTASDKIEFSQAVFSNLVASKAASTKGVAIATTDFYSATDVTTSSNTGAHLLYDSDSGSLYYDADGTGGGVGVQIALLGVSVHPTLAATDILIVL